MMAQTDLDLGHYDSSPRMSQRTTSPRAPCIKPSSWRVPWTNRAGHPHITDEIKRRIQNVRVGGFGIVEVGGTVSDIEGLPYLEAIRQFRADAGPENVLYIHLTLVPYVRTAGELKTKPTQHSVKKLLQQGISPHSFCRRIGRFQRRSVRRSACSATCSSRIIPVPDVAHIYQLPIALHEEGVDDRVLEKLGIWASSANLDAWQDLVGRLEAPSTSVRIVSLASIRTLVTYKSLNEALHRRSRA